MKFAAILVGLFLALQSSPSPASEIEPFIGKYEGAAVLEREDGTEQRRDLGVVIEEIDDGFRVNWETTTMRTDGSLKTKSYTIDFFPSNREHIYQSAMKANLFGGREPLDPMKGDPYVWAYIRDKTLFVQALIITEDGGYEMQTYERTRLDAGLALKFNRIRNGEPLREIRATLSKVD